MHSHASPPTDMSWELTRRETGKQSTQKNLSKLGSLDLSPVTMLYPVYHHLLLPKYLKVLYFCIVVL